MKNILVIIGHPNSNSFTHALSSRYLQGAQKSSKQVEIIDLSKINQDEYNNEEKISYYQKLISQCDHIVFIFPTWWGTPPAILKEFTEKIFTRGFAYRYKNDKSLKIIKPLLFG